MRSFHRSSTSTSIKLHAVSQCKKVRQKKNRNNRGTLPTPYKTMLLRGMIPRCQRQLQCKAQGLVAGETYYQNSCHLNYTRSADRSHHGISTSTERIKELNVVDSTEHRLASDNAFEQVSKYVNKHVLVLGSVVQI